MPALAPGESADLELPAPPAVSDGAEVQWTLRAVLAEDMPWAAAGHLIAWGQHSVSPRRSLPVARGQAPTAANGVIVLGPATFDAHTGVLTRLGSVPLAGPRLDVWRAPTDNDQGADRHTEQQYDRLWRQLGLHRIRHRVDGVELTRDALTVRTRVAPAGTALGLSTVYRWTADTDRLRLTVSVTPDGDWRVPLPRLGIRLGLPAAFGSAEWFGGGPGEAHPDTATASLIGRYRMRVDDMQTPYVRPQENGARPDVRRAQLSGGGATVQIDGEPAFWFTARRWTTERLDAASHLSDLAPGDTVWVHLDHAVDGIGSASCGPGVLPRYQLLAAPAEFSIVLSSTQR